MRNLINVLVAILKKTGLVELFDDAWAFLSNPEARTVSQFKYPNGMPMSVRYAKKEGLIK